MNDYTNGKIRNYDTITLHIDGGCEPRNPGGVASSGWVAFDKDDNILAKEGKVVADGGPRATNNFAEYCALGLALRWLSDQNWRGCLHVKSDSKLVVSQVTEQWKCNKEHLKKLRARIWKLLDQMKLWRCTPEQWKNLAECSLNENLRPATFQWIPRDENECADRMASEAYEVYCQQHGKQARYMIRRPKKKKPSQMFKCDGCGYTGNISEIGIEDGNMNCPICETGAIQFL